MSYDPQKVTMRQTADTAINAHRKTGQVKNELFWHARRCIKEKADNLADGLQLFLSKCAEEERWMTSKEAGPMHEESVPELWQQGKSDIKRAIEKGISPLDYPSYSALREAKGKAGKAAKAADKATSPEVTAKGTTTTTVEQALAEGTVVDAKNTTMCPEDLLPVIALLAPLTELARKRAVQKLIQIATVAQRDYLGSVKAGQQRRSA